MEEALGENENRELSRAREKIRTLNTELAMHNDAQVQVTVLRKKIAASKERAQSLVDVINRRIAYLYKLWDEYTAKKDDNEIIELARTAVNDPVRIGLDKGTDAKFFERVDTLKDKIAELLLLDDQAAEAHRRATEDNKTLNIATKKLHEVEERHKALLKTNVSYPSEENDPLRSIKKAIAALEERNLSNKANSEEKNDLMTLIKALHQLLEIVPNRSNHSANRSQSTTPDPHVISGSTCRSTTFSSSGISGVTVPTNESSSAFTTSSFPSTPPKNTQQKPAGKREEGQHKVESSSKSLSSSENKPTSTMDI